MRSEAGVHRIESTPVLLSIDVEDRQQLLERRVGKKHWNKPTETFRRQMTATLDTLDELGCRATHFMLGVTAKHYPDLVERVVERGDEIGCHGYAHRRVYKQCRAEFEDELLRAVELLEAMTGQRPRGFRAPWFSVNRDSMWMYDVLEQLGFEYDASINDTPRVPKRLREMPPCPARLRLMANRSIHVIPATCLQLPWKRRLPAGGGGYWRALPTTWVERAVHESISSYGLASLYLHPYEFDSEALSAVRPARPGLHLLPTLRASWDNINRPRILKTLRAVAGCHETTTFADGLQYFTQNYSTPTYTLSARGAFQLEVP